MPLDNRLGACYVIYIMEDKMTIKTCSKCGEEKPVTREYFYRRKTPKDAFRAACKVCIKQYRQANREAKAEYNKKYYQANQEAIAEQDKQRYQANREAILKQKKQYRQANREAKAEYNKKYREAKIAEQPACVYQIVNKQNGRIYVGETTQGELRWKSHLTYLRGGYHDNSNLQEDFNKFGEEAFEWSIIKELPKDREVLTKEEKLHIDSLIAEGKSLYNERLIS